MPCKCARVHAPTELCELGRDVDADVKGIGVLAVGADVRTPRKDATEPAIVSIIEESVHRGTQGW